MAVFSTAVAPTGRDDAVSGFRLVNFLPVATLDDWPLSGLSLGLSLNKRVPLPNPKGLLDLKKGLIHELFPPKEE